MSSRAGDRGAVRPPVTVTALLLVLVSVVLIGFSPLALGLFRGATGEWERLSFIGQTYGAASAVLSVLALTGVVLALSYQARETRRAREETRRQAISDLLKMAITDPELDACWGPVPTPGDPKSRKQQLYTNMITAAWEMSFEMRATPEHRLRVNANEMFRGQAGQDFWRSARENRLTTSANRRERRFHEILDEEYQRILAAGHRAEPEPGEHPPEHETARRRLLWMFIGAGLVTLLYRMLRGRLKSS